MGPPLWNAFFHDVEGPATFEGGTASIFADDLNVFQLFPAHFQNDLIYTTMGRTKANVHQWGRRNRVTFEDSKEALVIIHTSLGDGAPFKMLGCIFDVKLSMELEMDGILNKTRPKISNVSYSSKYLGSNSPSN